MTKSYSISFVGAGNLATSLIPAFHNAGHKIGTIYVRRPDTAKNIATKVNAKLCSIEELFKNNDDFIIIAVPDNAIESIIGYIANTNSIILHTSGSTSIDIMDKFSNYGVFYPLQTFSLARPINDFSKIPVFIEANSSSNLIKIQKLAESISNNVKQMASDARRSLHIAAVFSCNFVNRMLADAFELCNEYNIDPSYLQPLVDETINKAFASNNPATIQTGPAIRKDSLTINKHLEALENTDRYEIYKILTEYIQRQK